MQFQTILFTYKKCVTEKTNKLKHPLSMVFLSILVNKLPWRRHYGYLDTTLASKANERSVTAQLSAPGLVTGSKKFEEKEKGITTVTSFSSQQKEVGQIITRTSATTTTTRISKVDVARAGSK
jgi:hypothetical protein